MNHNDWISVYRNKHTNSTAHVCASALRDCHEALRVVNPPAYASYSIRLWAEIDAIRERQAEIERRILEAQRLLAEVNND